MENKINIAELLKDCPQGMELDCTMYENVTFEEVVGTIDCDGNEDVNIILLTHYNDGTDDAITLTNYGTYTYNETAKCVIFPKGKTTWEGFVPPVQFKDGDILATDLGSVFYLNTRLNTNECYGCYVGKGGDGSFHICEPFAYKECCGLATEEEKQRLFDAIKANGYKWNPETKTLEKLIEPKFKVGDRVRHCRVEGSSIYRVVKIEESKYVVQKNIGEYDYHIDFEVQDDWELVPNKFDITTLKPFDKVLVRDKNRQEWCISLFSHCNGLEIYKYSCINGSGYAQCVPYEENKHLLRTTNDCDEYYKIWE